MTVALYQTYSAQPVQCTVEGEGGGVGERNWDQMQVMLLLWKF